MANLIIISGPQAVGKMTVAEKLKEKISYNLMINHDSIEVSDKIFGFGTSSQKKLNEAIRESVFKIAIEENINLIFTFITHFDSKEDFDYLNNLRKMFENTGGNFYFVELEAKLETRLKRNITPHRLKSKPSKNDIEWSNNDLIEGTKYKLNSDDGEHFFPNHIKINNDNLSPKKVVNIILKEFGLEK